jgi:hypothetical protein
MNELMIALRESLKLQAHYAQLLNMYDEGERRIFKTPHEWIARLKRIGTISSKKNANLIVAGSMQIPDSVFRFEMFLDSEGRWCCAVNYGKYSRADTPEEALKQAILQQDVPLDPNHPQNLEKAEGE